MRTLKRLGASVLALGVAVAGMVMTAPLASAHTGTLQTSYVCQDDGTFKITYVGTTTRVPASGAGHVATLTVGELLPAGSTVVDAPPTVTGNTTYTFHQIVPGTTTQAQATAFLKWGDGAKSDPIGKVTLPHNCTAPVAPSGDLTTDCLNGAGHVAAANLSNGTASNVSWRLVTGTDASHTNVVAGPSAGAPLEVNNLADATKVWLQVSKGNGWADEGSVVTTGNCTPAPSGVLTTDCVDNAGQVVASNLLGGPAGTEWRLVTGTTVLASTGPAANTSTPRSLTASGLADSTTVKLQVNTGNGTWVDKGNAVTTGKCKPVVVPPSGSFTVVCSTTGATVTVGTLGSGTHNDVVWTLTFGSDSKAVHTGDVVAVPALAALALKYSVGGSDSHTVQSDTAPAACVVTGQRSLDIAKAVSPTGDAEFGDTLTYTLKVTAGGTLGQSNVVVSDYIPGYQPGRDSGKTTYVPGSAACDAGTCSAAYDGSAKLITWGLGDMAAGTTRTVTFKVTIDSPAESTDGSVAATTIYNSGTVGSTETSTKPSNEVVTPVTAVLGVKQGQKPPHNDTPDTAVLGSSLPHTGGPAHLPWTLGMAALFLLLGTALVIFGRKPEVIEAR
jgi:uncharacterized repeat protein (TIGR01451 family)